MIRLTGSGGSAGDNPTPIWTKEVYAVLTDVAGATIVFSPAGRIEVAETPEQVLDLVRMEDERRMEAQSNTLNQALHEMTDRLEALERKLKDELPTG